MAINDIFELGRLGLNANRKALQTASNNIANTNTPGYSRQKPIFQQRESFLQDGIRIGGGVEVNKVIRVHDQFVQNQILQESKAFGGLRAKVDSLQKAEAVIHREGERLDELTNKFFNDYRELSVNPETLALRTVTKASAENLALGFRKANQSLEALKADFDLRIEGTINEVNGIAKEIAALNEKISTFEAYTEVPNEMYDKRDMLLQQLAEKVEYEISADERGQINIVVGNGALITGNQSYSLYAERTPGEGNKADNSLDIFIREPLSNRNITKVVKDGVLGGMLHVRDNIVNKSLMDLDHVAYALTNAVNEAHRGGVGLDDVGERNLFNDLSEHGVHGASYRFSLSESIAANPEMMAVGRSMSTPGDNSVALDIANVHQKELLPSVIGEDGENRHSINQAINSVVAGVGANAAREEAFFRHQEAVMDQLEKYRQSMSGVSLEEEAINMMQYQLIFNASAKSMKVGDEMLQTILTLKD